MRPTTPTRLAALAAVLPVLLISGCGSDSGTSGSGDESSSPSSASSSRSGSPSSSPTSGTTSASPSPDKGLVIDVTVQGDTVTPNGKRLSAEVGKPVTLRITANRPGELHVHSTPEQELAYRAGKSTLRVTIDKPGIVDIEDHVADVVVVQLEVS